MKFCLIIVFFASAYAIDFNCLKGPKYWCASLQNAEKCGRVTECFISNGNGKEVVKMSNIKMVDNCDLCTKVITELEKMFIPNMTEAELVSFLENNICPRLGTDLSALCKVMVEQYGPQIYAELNNILLPKNVCSMIHLCGAPKVSFKFLSNSSPETCKVCKELFAFLETYFSKLSPAEFKALLKMALCNQLPAEVKEMCNTVVDGYSDQLYQLVKSLLDGDKVCPAIHLCSTGIKSSVNSWSCTTCIDVVTVLKKDLINVSAGDIEGLIQAKVCDKLSILIKGFCINEVNQMVPEFVNDIHSGMTPQQLCSKRTLCAAPSEKPVVPVAKKTLVGSVECDACEIAVGEFKKLIFSKDGEVKVENFVKTRVCPYFGKQAQECSDFVNKYGGILIDFINTRLTSKEICELLGVCSETSVKLSTMSKVDGPECTLCKFFLTELKKYIADPNNQTKMKNFLKSNVCVLFDKAATQCQQVIDEYFSIIINVVISEFDIPKICEAFKLCPKTFGTVECKVCEVAMDELVAFITSNASEQRIMEFLTKDLCPRLGDLSNECGSLVKQYLPFIFQMVKQSLNGQIICSRLHLCAIVSEKNVKSLIKSLGVKSYQCDLCQFAINETIAMLSDPKIQSLVENLIINDICPLFGANQQECKKDITEYYSFVINLILQFLKPSLCADIHLCSSSPMMKLRQPISPAIESSKSIECAICPRIFKFFKTIDDKTTSNDIVLGLVNICGKYYHEDKRRCLLQIKNLLFLLETFKAAKTERDFCETSKLCPSTRTSQMLGKVRCSWGPGFWCVSRRHAEFCGVGAVRHCEVNVWKGAR